MNTRAFTLALIIACFAMFMVYTYMEDKEADLIKRYGTPTTVVVAKKEIKELDLIDDRSVGVITVPQNFASPGHFKTIKEVENTIATTGIAKGEQITKPRVTYPEAQTGLARQVSVGKRAIAINITEKQAVSKLIKPGDRVDVLAAVDFSSGRKDLQKTKTIIQDVIVLSTGKSMTNAIPIYGIKNSREIRKMKVNTYTQYNTVTLELSPYQVQKMVYLLSYSGYPLFLSLRNNQDKDVVRIKSTDIYSVIGDELEKQEAKSFFVDKYKQN